MPARFRTLSLAVCASAFFLPAVDGAQQNATTGAASPPAGVPAKAANAAPETATEAAQKMIAAAIERMNANDLDGALNDLSRAVELNPNSSGAYVLRASIYCQKQHWTQAEDDFKAAARLAPTNAVLKFNLVEVKFMQKQYDVARPGFVALEQDPEMGDFASYKVFLCDLFGGHEAVAKKELDAFNANAMGNPSYEFSNAAWQLVHRQIEGDDGARYWLLRASRIYPPRKNMYYAQSLRDLGYLPIPGPNDKVTAPSGANAQSPP
jgi:tetratricopeptide (TPR) repeat protein